MTTTTENTTSVSKEINEKYSFSLAPPPSFESLDIFLRPAFFSLHSYTCEEAICLQLFNKKKKSIEALCHLLSKDRKSYKSPLKGSYGGFYISQDLSLDVLQYFLERTEEYLIKNGAESLSFTLPPFAYHPQKESICTNLLLKNAYVINNHELNYSIDIHSHPFQSIISHGQRKKINLCLRNDVEVCKLPENDLKKAYDVIVENRLKKGNIVSMTWEQLYEMQKSFPNDVISFLATHKNRPLASAICIRINPNILYVFYWGEVTDVGALSPVVLIANELYSYCQDENIKLLDLGTSTVDGHPNIGLIRFKKSLGSSESLKLSFLKQL
jgi:hypothetical protein